MFGPPVRTPYTDDVEHLELAYLFLTFAVGIACFGVAVGLATRRGDALSRAFLAFYGALTVAVTASLLLAVGDAAPDTFGGTGHTILVYAESIVGFYGMMFALPFFAHRVFGVASSRRDLALVAIVGLTAGIQHVTEIVLGSTPWDARGDVLENLVFAGIVAYTLWIGIQRVESADAHQPLARRFLILMIIGVPGLAFDLFAEDVAALRVYPLGYCILSLVVTWTLVSRHEVSRHDAGERASEEPASDEPSSDGEPSIDPRWGLSVREADVARWAARGLSNKAIGATLHISPNTVKTHLRAVFEKVGVRSRFELMARTTGGNQRNHPKG